MRYEGRLAIFYIKSGPNGSQSKGISSSSEGHTLSAACTSSTSSTWIGTVTGGLAEQQLLAGLDTKSWVSLQYL